MHVEEPPPDVARWIFPCGEEGGKMAGKRQRRENRVCGEGKKVMSSWGRWKSGRSVVELER